MKIELAYAGHFIAEKSRTAWAAIRRHPVLALTFLPAVAVAYVLALVPFTPSITDLRKAKAEQPTLLLSEDGQELATFKRANRDWIKLADISPHVLAALLATEDNRFYEHHGLDVKRTAAAVLHTLRGDMQGGSTLTQQLARNLYPDDIGRAPTVTRKLKEAITALKIEAVYSKPEILETYLNTVPFLFNAWGIDMAARTYFDKNASDLDVLESATLIGMLKGTSYYNPVLNPERAVARRNIVLGQMVRREKLTQANFDVLKVKPLGLDFERQTEAPGPAPHFARQVRRWLVEWADRNGYNIHADGLRVRTTIDSRLQAMANQAVVRQADKLQLLADKGRAKGQAPQVLQAGLLALDPATGRVRAWVGSRDFSQDQFDHVQQARRQPGSTFKPFVYGAAFEQGISPSELLIDQAVEIRFGGNGVWRPTDAMAPTGEPMAVRDGLIFSKNTITAQVMQRVGPARVAELARAMGVRQSKLDEVPSLALGTSPVTLKEMVSAYGTIANGGSFIEPVLVTRIEDRNGVVLAEIKATAPQTALPMATAQTLLDVMRGVIDKGTGAGIRSRFGITGDVAGKTGTTQDNTDGWFILMHPQLVAGAWVGFNDNRMTMGNSWGQGAHSALPIVGDFFQQSLKSRIVEARARFNAPRDPGPPPSLPVNQAPELPLEVSGTQVTRTPEQVPLPQLQVVPQVHNVPPLQSLPQFQNVPEILRVPADSGMGTRVE